MAAYGAEDRLGLARHYLTIGNPRRALAELEKSGTGAFEDAEFWAIRAESMFELRRWSEGADAARRGLADMPDYVTLLDILAICEFELGHKREAEECILAALEVSPDHPTLLAHRAIMLARAKRFDEAEDVVAEAMRVDPRSPDVMLARANVANLRGDRRNAAEYADELLELEPDSDFSHVARGNADVRSARFKNAVRHYEEAARLNPEKAQIHEVLREARIGAHPLLAPLRPLLRFGRWRSYGVYLAIVSVLAVARLESLRWAVAGLWITLIAISWIVPPILRRWYGRKHRGL